MRVTNSMMRNNSLLNMQKNKNAYNKYLMQYNTQSKIQRPSDDPTIAVRALKYRTTLAEVTQYLKNIDDATSWMDATDKSLSDISDVVGNMQEYCTQAANGTNSSDNRKDILAQLKEYSAFIYEQDANADYNGRYLFTGYRTDVPLLFDAVSTNTTYTITEDIDINKIDKYQYVYGGAVYDENKTASDYANEAAQFKTTHRVMVSYTNCDEADLTVQYTDKDGNVQNITAIRKSIGDNTINNEHLNPGEDEVYFIPETGEVVFGDNIYDSIRGGSNLSVTYDKSEFQEGDIRPEHYFNCKTVDQVTGVTATYAKPASQNMNYQIYFSQTLSVNTMACNAVDTSIARMIDDVTNVCNDIDTLEAQIKSVEKRIEDCDENDTTTLANLNELKNQLDTQLSLQKTVLTKTLGAAVTTCQKAQDKIGVAIADHGSRHSRLTITQAKLKQQKTDTEEAKSDNEDADLGEAYINFSEADLLYQATLNATNKILGQSLLNFI